MNLRDIFGDALPWIASSNRSQSINRIRLPRDERPHRSKMEWWHFMGYVEPRSTSEETELVSKIENRSIAPEQLSDFQGRLEKLRNERQSRRLTFVMSILRGQIMQVSQLASIVILTDHERKTYTTSVKLGAMSSSYFELQDGRAFRFHFGARGPARIGPPDGWSAIGGMGTYTLAIDTTKQLSLELTQQTPAVFLDEHGRFQYGRDEHRARVMAYYLWPQLEVVGILGTGADEQPVVGQAWMEHQWGDVPIGDYRWSYLAVAIDAGDHKGRWVFFSTEERKGAVETDGGESEYQDDAKWEAFWIQGDGRVVHIPAGRVKLTRKLHEVYPIVVGIQIVKMPKRKNGPQVQSNEKPERSPSPKSNQSITELELAWTISPVQLNQECRSNLPGGMIPPFWEGACDVFAANGKKKEKLGWAIMELAGYR